MKRLILAGLCVAAVGGFVASSASAIPVKLKTGASVLITPPHQVEFVGEAGQGGTMEFLTGAAGNVECNKDEFFGELLNNSATLVKIKLTQGYIFHANGLCTSAWGEVEVTPEGLPWEAKLKHPSSGPTIQIRRIPPPNQKIIIQMYFINVPVVCRYESVPAVVKGTYNLGPSQLFATMTSQPLKLISGKSGGCPPESLMSLHLSLSAQSLGPVFD